MRGRGGFLHWWVRWQFSRVLIIFIFLETVLGTRTHNFIFIRVSFLLLANSSTYKTLPSTNSKNSTMYYSSKVLFLLTTNLAGDVRYR